MSANGSISNVTLQQAALSVGNVAYEVRITVSAYANYLLIWLEGFNSILSYTSNNGHHFDILKHNMNLPYEFHWSLNCVVFLSMM